MQFGEFRREIVPTRHPVRFIRHSWFILENHHWPDFGWLAPLPLTANPAPLGVPSRYIHVYLTLSIYVFISISISLSIWIYYYLYLYIYMSPLYVALYLYISMHM